MKRKKLWITLIVIAALCLGGLIYWLITRDPIGDQARIFADRLIDAGKDSVKVEQVYNEIDAYYNTLTKKQQAAFDKALKEAIESQGEDYHVRKAKEFAQMLANIGGDAEKLATVSAQIDEYYNALDDKKKAEFDAEFEKAVASQGENQSDVLADKAMEFASEIFGLEGEELEKVNATINDFRNTLTEEEKVRFDEAINEAKIAVQAAINAAANY